MVKEMTTLDGVTVPNFVRYKKWKNTGRKRVDLKYLFAIN